MSKEFNMEGESEFLTKKTLFCQNHCNFKFIPTLVIKDTNYERICEGAVLCQYCGFFDTVEIDEVPKSITDALQEPGT